MGAEYELKYAADEKTHRAIREAFGDPWIRTAMQTTYYDTPEGDLRAAHITLRLRLENGTPVCTLKTPGRDGVRGEWEVVCDTIEAAVPELCKLSACDLLMAVTGKPLAPLCGARFTRMARTVRIPGGEAELALDSGILFGGGREIPLCEVEAELKEGTKAALDAFGQELSGRFSLREEYASKFKRASALVMEES